MTGAPDDASFARAWREHRPYLVDVAFRMLGDVGEAEDVVQEAFTRLMRTRAGEIENERGWLTVVTSRLCLDQIRSARARRQRLGDVPERASAGGDPADGDPADRVTLDDGVRLALLVVLENLSPAERVVFVLHDVFQIPFETVAETVGRTVVSCRQLARRARLKVENAEGSGRFEVPDASHRLITERFIAACTTGDVAALLEVLDPRVSGTVDLEPGRVVVGADSVSANLMRFWGRGRATLVSTSAHGQPVILAFVERQLAGVILLSVRDRLVGKIHVLAEDSKLKFLRYELAGRTAP